MSNKVLVFRSEYLPISETFVSDHLRSLQRYSASVVCERDMPAAHRVPIAPVVLPQRNFLRRLLYRFGLSWTFRRAMKAQAPDLVHVHFLTDAARIIAFMERNKIPLVITAHGFDATIWDEELAKDDEGRFHLSRRQRIIDRVDKVICVSDLVRNELIERGYPPAKLEVCYLGIDLAQFQMRAASDMHRGIVAVGRLVQKKGMRYLLDAYAAIAPALRAEHPLTIIGDGPLRAELERHAAWLGISVRFLGARPREDVLSTLKESAVFCLPSVRADNGDSEGMPIAIMEALAMGVPVCIFDDQPTSGLLAERDAGGLAKGRDAADLGRTLEGLLADPVRARQVAVRGRELAVSMFDLQKNTQALEKLYDSVRRQ